MSALGRPVLVTGPADVRIRSVCPSDVLVAHNAQVEDPLDKLVTYREVMEMLLENEYDGSIPRKRAAFFIERRAAEA